MLTDTVTTNFILLSIRGVVRRPSSITTHEQSNKPVTCTAWWYVRVFNSNTRYKGYTQNFTVFFALFLPLFPLKQ